jgi:hypothetical protein
VRLTEVLKHRLVSVPRLRQRLVDVPFGCGRPVWVDYSGFEFDEHFAVVRCPGPITEESVLGYAAEQLTTRLPRDRPLWAATLLSGRGDRAALVLVSTTSGGRHRGALRPGRRLDEHPAGRNFEPDSCPGQWVACTVDEISTVGA